MIALRPHDQNWFVNQVFVYEQPHTVLWPVKSFTPNYFIKIDVEDKIRTYKLYKSQVRKHRSPEIIRTIASLRGSQCNLAYAKLIVVSVCILIRNYGRFFIVLLFSGEGFSKAAN
jgi:hypothetical protein